MTTRAMYPMDVESGEGLAFIEATSRTENEQHGEDGGATASGLAMADLDEDERAAFIVPYLARRNYHIPGNTWFQDWFQYVFANNHPIFGLCCHYKHHPVSNGTRILVFFGTLCASLAIFNTFYLYFLWKDGDVKEAASFQTNITIVQGSEYLTLTTVTFSHYEIALWTLGAFIHTLYDMSIWTIAACAICAPGGALEQHADKRWIGKFLTFFIVLATASIATLLVILRASVNEDDVQNINSGGIFDDTVNFEMALEQSAYLYLRAWAIAFVLALFVYNLIISTILFSGFLGCAGEFPVLGGRPYEVKQQLIKRKKAEKKLRRKSRSRKSTVGVAPMEGSKGETSTIATAATSKSDAESVKRRASRGGRSSVVNISQDPSRSKDGASLQRRASRKSTSSQRDRTRRTSASRKSVNRGNETSGSAQEQTRRQSRRTSASRKSVNRGNETSGSAQVTRNSTTRTSKDGPERITSTRSMASAELTSSSPNLRNSSSQGTKPSKTVSTERSSSKARKKKTKKKKKEKSSKKKDSRKATIVEEV